MNDHDHWLKVGMTMTVGLLCFVNHGFYFLLSRCDLTFKLLL